ncbi:MAG: flagellar biosynthesis anti-sigma factor FlgM [Leptospirillum sp.]|jgi:negative regulator of flagellin synthesis FlgM|nr:flagellar biosynthesis anti-sigma factor FlgM [Nitrospiraceae bacterium]
MSEDWGSVGNKGPAPGGQEAVPLRKKAASEGVDPAREAAGSKPGMSASGETDMVVISGPARQIARLREQIDREPSVRMEKIIELKTRIHRGEYNVPARDILRKMVEQALNEAKNRGKR